MLRRAPWSEDAVRDELRSTSVIYHGRRVTPALAYNQHKHRTLAAKAYPLLKGLVYLTRSACLLELCCRKLI